MEWPTYVRLGIGGCCLRYGGKGTYHRHAGQWDLLGKEVDGKLVVHVTKSHPLAHANGLELIKCTKEEWAEDNAGYVDGL